MKIAINVPDEYYEEIIKLKFHLQEPYLITLIKEGEIIEEETENVEIRTAKPGTTIEVNDIQMQVLDNRYAGKHGEIGVFCLAKDILFDKAFNDENNNNWEMSSLRKYLNDEYKKSLDKGLISALIPFKRNLLTDDGMKDYGICADWISLISEREYQDYREYISDKSDWWWTLTARSANPHDTNVVRVVNAKGILNNGIVYNSYIGVSPAFLIKPNFKVKIIDDKK